MKKNLSVAIINKEERKDSLNNSVSSFKDDTPERTMGFNSRMLSDDLQDNINAFTPKRVDSTKN